MLFVAKKDNDIIGHVWLVVRRIRNPFFYGEVNLKHDEALILNANIKKEYRGKDIYNKLKAYVFHDLKKKGYKRVIGFYLDKNVASSKSNKRFGSKIIGKLKCFIILSLSIRYHNIPTVKIHFYDGPMIFWRRLYRKMKGQI